MQKVFRSCYELDQKCYETYGLTEDILMEHAAMGMELYIRRHFDKGSSVCIVSGMGNNGADGIVLARLLFKDYDVKLYMPFGLKSAMAKLQLAGIALTKRRKREATTLIAEAKKLDKHGMLKDQIQMVKQQMKKI
ncbi:MAG: NAD(P)H-hydrate epimerase [Eudoraea sp.]|nr:NAD(P)H-hydrate epimerase [Eudoraea sp.]